MACANLIELVEYVPSEPRVMIVMEYCNNGNLEEMLNEKCRWRIMNLQEIQHVFMQLGLCRCWAVYKSSRLQLAD